MIHGDRWLPQSRPDPAPPAQELNPDSTHGGVTKVPLPRQEDRYERRRCRRPPRRTSPGVATRSTRRPLCRRRRPAHRIGRRVRLAGSSQGQHPSDDERASPERARVTTSIDKVVGLAGPVGAHIEGNEHHTGKDRGEGQGDAPPRPRDIRRRYGNAEHHDR